MPALRLEAALLQRLGDLEAAGRRKGAESVICGVVPARDGKGPRYLLEGHGERPFLRMNSNGYLGLALNSAVRAAEDEAVRSFGSGPGAVRFISGTWAPHIALESRLAAFHEREAAMIYSSAYATTRSITTASSTPLPWHGRRRSGSIAISIWRIWSAIWPKPREAARGRSL
jgi:glycine C-acetyltransferase